MISLAAAFALTGVICSISGLLVYFKTRDASPLCDHLIVGGSALELAPVPAIGPAALLFSFPN